MNEIAKYYLDNFLIIILQIVEIFKINILKFEV